VPHIKVELTRVGVPVVPKVAIAVTTLSTHASSRNEETGDPLVRVTRLGEVIFAVSFAGFGVLSLISGAFELLWKLFPALGPGREAIAYASGLMLLAGGVGMLLPRTARLGTLVITVNVLLSLLLLGLPRVVAHPTNELMWLNFGQNLMLVTGGWTLLGSFAGQGGSPVVRSATNARGLSLALVLYAIALPLIGLSHFVYVKAAVSAVPAWLPYRTAFAYLTGAGHIAAGLGILFGIVPRLAATAEAMMISIFLLLVWVPSIVASPATREPWMEFFITATCAGAAWAIAGSLQGAAWGLARQSAPRTERSPESA
jgi:uncharacterized membrane protein